MAQQRQIRKSRPFPHGLTVAYVGNGKGKTTAAVGAAVRAAGYGWKVLVFQFFKSEDWPSGERQALQKLGVDVEIHGKGFVGILGDRKPKAEHQREARRALSLAWARLVSGKYKLVVLDELIACVEVGLLPVSAVAALLTRRAKHTKAKHVHCILTGHKRYAALNTACDLVTDMRMVKHPYYKGYLAVRGIDY